jgi:RNA 2',3'-cyclic 3'-phosphodiesterase
MRTFIAIPLPEGARSTLSQIQDGLRATGADVRWTAVPSIHLTLKFLGEIDPGLVAQLALSLKDATRGEAPFSLAIGGVGAFPNLRNPRVVWCGIEGEMDRLHVLQKRVEEACSGLGFAPEDRPFSPHLTLGRVKGSRSLPRLLDCIRIGSPLRTELQVGQLHIYKSTLTPAGAIYSVLERIDLVA